MSERDPERAFHEPPSELDRRQLMKLLAAGAGLAGLGPLAACMEKPRERIRPRVEDIPGMTPGLPLEYATTMVIDGFATGLVVRTHEARPTKIEGNPEHPASLGATSQFHQASVLDVYDPHRARTATEHGTPIDLASYLRTLAQRAALPGLWFLVSPQSSPLLEALFARVRARHPGARIATFAPLDRTEVYAGAQRAFGRPVEAQYRFREADVIVSLDADFTAAMPNALRWARDFATRRRIATPAAEMSRLFVAEPRPSPTGSLADHRLPSRPSRIEALAAGLLAAVRGARIEAGFAPRERQWLNAAAANLVRRRGRGLVVVGDRQPASVHALGHAINAAIEAAGHTVVYTRPALIDPLGDGLRELVAAAGAGGVRTLVIADANPVYAAPAYQLDAVLARIPETIYLGRDRDETAARCRWHLPLAHYLEAWGDARAYDGTLSLIQPVIRPLVPCVSLPALVAAFAGDEHPDVHALLRAQHALGEPDWANALRRGFLTGSAFGVEQVTARTVEQAPAPPAAGIELSFDASHAVHDGQFAENPWLQELPKPHDKLTWGNAAILAPATARTLGVGMEDVVRIAHANITVELPVYVLPGHAEDCVSLELGYGRRTGAVADGVGTDVYPLRALARGHVTGATITATGATRRLARTQEHFDQLGREIAPVATLAHARAHPDFTAHLRGRQPSLLPRVLETTPQWAMTIDTMICTGCSACVIACQAENNIPVVGASEVMRNREMHWLRIDTYRAEVDGDVQVVHQPMLCQHCEKAPCEYVCPTYATQHSPDGLNEMVYNRCIGTRFCSNNCPYKVRRFNWFDFTGHTPKSQRLQFNPNVTVRARGVMEKCTYCVQRIRRAEIEARKAHREILPGEVVTACQQACPTGAIQFGALHHRALPVVQWREEARCYAVLHHLGARPRTMYLAKVENPDVE